MRAALDGVVATRHWRPVDGGRVECSLCPRGCRLREGERGQCYVRAARGGAVVLTTYGRSTGFRVEPVESRPLYHFLPGTPALCLGAAGCNLTCRSCANWRLSRAEEMSRLLDAASPEFVALAARQLGCRSVAFVDNDPVVYHEYAVDVAEACRHAGLQVLAVTAGYVSAEPRLELFRHVDAANVELKGFSEAAYERRCGGRLQPVLETLAYLRHETTVWLETTLLLSPGDPDGEREIAECAGWIAERLSPDVPLHLALETTSGLADTPADAPLLGRARATARRAGLHHVYTRNLSRPDEQATLCAGCHRRLVARTAGGIGDWRLTRDGRCRACGTTCAGVFEAGPGRCPRRMRVRLRERARAAAAPHR